MGSAEYYQRYQLFLRSTLAAVLQPLACDARVEPCCIARFLRERDARRRWLWMTWLKDLVASRATAGLYRPHSAIGNSQRKQASLKLNFTQGCKGRTLLIFSTPPQLDGRSGPSRLAMGSSVPAFQAVLLVGTGMYCPLKANWDVTVEKERVAKM